MAKDGSAPHACAATTSSEVVEVLPCVPATATHAPVLERGGERGGAAQHRHAAGRGPRRTPSCCGLIAVV